ncbi:MAG TPA: Ig-like domain-containing protein [Candidatus Edwardsbacteria bacterium]|nr:Ig-like domain-containing protein [Candidatus Edwardsbacteria bacterium]
MKKTVLAIGLVLICCGISFGQTTIFSDDLSSFPTGWTLSPSSGGWTKTTSRYNSASSSARGDDANPYAASQSNTMSRAVGLSGYASATLKFYCWQYTESGYDSLVVEYYSGSSWTKAWSRSGSYQSWSQQSVPIPTTATQLRFRFKSDVSVQYEGAYVDDIVLTAAAAAADTVKPSCSVTAPAAGATVSGTTTISATAADNVGVSSVEFYVDGVLKATDTSSPYSYSWSTTSSADGSHSLTCKAYDAAGNVGASGAVSVTVKNSTSTTPAKIVCFDVGQGDATFIQSPTGKYVLIDGGPSSTTGTKVWKFLRDSIHTHHVDYIFISHFHDDHIGGLTAAIDSIKAHGIDSIKGGVYDHGGTYSSTAFTNYAAAAGSKRMTPAMGQVFDLGGGMTIKVVCMNGTTITGNSITPSEENANSLGLLLSYNGFKMVIASDIGGYNSGSYKDQESILAPGVGSVNVLYVNHHGSSTSSNPTWISTLDPQASIISCGDGNSYGHPTAAALTRLTADPGANNYIYQTETGDGGTIPSGRGKVMNSNIWITINASTFTISSNSYSITKGGDVVASLPQPATAVMAQDFSITAAYPNPVRGGQATVRYQLRSPGYVTLALYNMLGQKVRTLASGHQPAGEHTVNWQQNGSRLADGVYVYRLAVIAGGTVYEASRRMLLVK